MSKTLRVVVTQEHIFEAIDMRHGHWSVSAHRCPIALAVGHRAIVGLDQVRRYWPLDIERDRWTLPPEAVEYRRRFDWGRPVAPITFTMERAP